MTNMPRSGGEWVSPDEHAKHSEVSEPKRGVGYGGYVIPCYNHDSSLDGVIAELQRMTPQLPILIVDDGSRPAVTPRRGIRLVRHPANQGKGAALLTGLRHYADSDFVVFVDADGQCPVHEIPKLVDTFLESEDTAVVTAARDFRHDSSIPLRHRLANLFLSAEFRVLFGKQVPDVTNGLRVVRPRTLLAYGMRLRRYEVDIEILRSMLALGLKVRSVPVMGTRYPATSTLNRGLAVTSVLAFSMVKTRLQPTLSRIRSAQTPNWAGVTEAAIDTLGGSQQAGVSGSGVQD